MKKHLLICITLFLSLAAAAQTNAPNGVTGPSSATARPLPSILLAPGANYLRSFIPARPSTDTADVNMSAPAEDVSVQTRYFDDMGRTLQTITKQASPLKKDYVIPVTYDSFGRIAVQYLPYVQQSGNANDGKFKNNAFVSDSSFYRSIFPNEQVIYRQMEMAASPLGTTLKSTAEGNSWGGSDHGIAYTRRANATADSVRLWTIDINSEDDLPATASAYQAGSLLVNETQDERGVKSISYTDELGRLILTKVQLAASPSQGHSGWLCTYYVYDETNHLRMIIPPKAVDLLNGSIGWDLAGNGSIATGLCYAYFYNARGKCIAGRVPGKGKTYIAYDAYDRVVMVQDSGTRASNQWVYSLYDAQGRAAKTGLITTSLTKDSVIAQASRSASYPSLTGTYTVLSETYYDDYAWISSTGAPVSSTLTTTNITSANFFTTYNASPEYAQAISPSAKTRGAVTGIKKAIIGTASYLYTVALYDEEGRAIQVKETNYTGGTDITTSQYSFNGKLLRTHFQHQKSGANSQTHTLLTKLAYDHTGRLKTIVKNIDGLGDKTIITNTYNELGALASKALGAAETQRLDYNIRGWLTAINGGYVDSAASASAYFGERLSYDFGFTNSTYNGGISGVRWKAAGDGVARAYGFSYDNANRLTGADFNQQNPGSSSWTKDKADFSVDNLTYDANGNILTMRQRGVIAADIRTIDSLNYQYLTNSNQLKKVSDGIVDDSPLGDFKDSAASGDDYAYDADGNVSKDYNRRMFSSTNGAGAVYNFLNKPDSIIVAGESTTYYYYDASGNKLKKKVNDYTSGSLVTKSYLYVNGFVYLNDTLQYVLEEGGRIRYAQKVNAQTGTPYRAFEYDYFLCDHLGNVRSVLTEGRDTAVYAASMEAADSTHDKALFSNIYDPSNTVYPKPSGFDSDGGNQYVSRLNASSSVNRRTGPSLVLKVMKGDQIQISTFAFYNSAAQQPSSGAPSLLTELVSMMSPGIIGGSGGKLAGINGAAVSNALSPNVLQFLNSGVAYDTTRPKAYLNWILFDEQFNYVSSNSGAIQVQSGSTKQALIAPLQDISHSGYLYVFLSNESPQNVFFDDINVKHLTGPLLAEQSYYPFGLEMAALSSQALTKLSSQYKFNGGVELEEETGLYNTFYRQYDQQIGRFTGADILSENTASISNYQFGFNNPVYFNDPMGDLSQQGLFDIIGTLWEKENGGSWSASTPNMLFVFGDQATAITFGGWAAAGGSGSDNPMEKAMERVLERLRALDQQGYKITGVRYEENKQGVFGARFSFNGRDESDINNITIGTAFVPLPEMKTGATMDALTKLNTYVSMMSGIVEGVAGKTTFGSNMRLYPSGWRGNQYVATVKISKAARVIGWATLVLGTLSDVDGVITYYKKGEDAEGAVNPAKATINLGMGLAGMLGGPIGVTLATIYFGIDATIGWPNAIKSYITVEQNKAYMNQHHITSPSDYKF